MKRSRQTRRMCALAVAAGLQLVHANAQAGISFSGGSVQYTHFKNNGSSIDVDGPFSITSAGHHNYSHSFSQSHDGVTAKTNARGGVGIVSNATTATFTLDSGTGVTESDPAPNPVWGAGSRLRINLNSLQWSATSPSFGPTATAYFSITVAGVIGSGGSGTFSPNIVFSRSGSLNFATITSGMFPTSSTQYSAGTFSKTLTKSIAVPSGSIPTSGTFSVNGHLDFHANNEDTPTLIEPIVVDAGGAPPTARFDSDDEITPLGGVTWNNPLVWSAEQEFVPGGVPNHAGDRAFFAPPTNAPRARAVSIDAATVTLGTLDIDDVFGGSMTVASNSGTLQFQVQNGGTMGTDVQNAVIQQRNTRGNAIAEISAPVQLMNPLDVHVNSSAGMTISGAINTAPGIISTPINKFGPGVLTLSGNNSFVGGIVVNEGGLVLSGGAIVNIPITAAAGTTVTLNTTSPGVIFDTDFNVGTTGGARTIYVTGLGISTPGLSGAAPLTLNAPSTLSITSNSNNTGTVAIASGTLSLTDGGNMTGVPEFVNNGVLRLDNSGGANQDRIGNTATVRLRGSQMRVDAHASTAVSESYGATILDGATSTVTLANSGAAALTVTSSALQRQNNSVLFLRGDNLGSAPGSRLIFTAAPSLLGGGGAPGTTNISILPFAVGATSSGAIDPTSHVTYTATEGLRPLAVGEYVNGFAAPTSNVRITGGASLNVAQTINSLLGINAAITGTGTLTVSSGAVLLQGSPSSIATSLNFGVREGIMTTTAPIGTVTVSGAVLGSAGLTKAGRGTLVLNSGTSSYGGPTTILSGAVVFQGNVNAGTVGPLGMSSAGVPVVLAPGAEAEARLLSGSASATFGGRNLIARASPGGEARFGTTQVSNQTLTVNSSITLESGLTFVGSTIFANGAISGTGEITDAGTATVVQLAGNNSFTGGVNVVGGTYRIASNTAMGTGPVTFKADGLGSTGALQAVGTARTVGNPIVLEADPNISGSTTLTLSGPISLGGTRAHAISNTADTIYAGQLMNGGLTKAGTGRLILSNYNNYNGVTTVAAGELLVFGLKPLGDPVSGTIVNNGATLRLGQNLEFDLELGVLVPNPARMVEPVTINGTGVGGSGALRGSATATAVGTLTLASASTVHVEPTNTLAVLTLADFNSTLTLNGGGTLAVDRVRGGNVIINGSTLTVRPCTLTTNPRTNAASTIVALNISGGGALNLNNNALVINYAGASPLAATSALLATGYNAGAWNGPGIRSKDAADTPNTAIGVAEAFETNYVGNFFGQPIDTTSLLLVYTRAGDANLDRIVNIADFSKLAANFNQSSTWARGDFNYDGMTNISDFAILAANFNQSAPPDADPPRTAVPEPAGSLLLTFAAAVRRRRF